MAHFQSVPYVRNKISDASPCTVAQWEATAQKLRKNQNNNNMQTIDNQQVTLQNTKTEKFSKNCAKT
jgi:hypothetical protein